MAICNHKSDNPLYMWPVMMSDWVICKHRKEYGHTRHQMSLLRPGVIKQHKKTKKQNKKSLYVIIIGWLIINV